SALPDLAPEAAADRELVPPRSEAEHLVARAFSDHLRRGAPVSIQDDFFLDLGGNSLLAAQTVSTLRKSALTSPLTVRDVYEARTAEGLAALADAASTTAPREDRRRDGSRIGKHPTLVSLLQLACILGKLLAGSVVAYLIAFRLLPGGADTRRGHH